MTVARVTILHFNPKRHLRSALKRASRTGAGREMEADSVGRQGDSHGPPSAPAAAVHRGGLREKEFPKVPRKATAEVIDSAIPFGFDGLNHETLQIPMVWLEGLKLTAVSSCF